MAKYTLDETWKHCLQLWKWIAGKIKATPDLDIIDLKGEWFEEHDFDNICDDCFFCDYTIENPDGDGCEICPGRLVDPEFNCENPEYHYCRLPIKFYEKLLELDKKR